MTEKVWRLMDLTTVSKTRNDYWEKKLKEDGIDFKSSFLDITKHYRIKFSIPEDRLNQCCQKLLLPYEDIKFEYGE